MCLCSFAFAVVRASSREALKVNKIHALDPTAAHPAQAIPADVVVPVACLAAPPKPPTLAKLSEVGVTLRPVTMLCLKVFNFNTIRNQKGSDVACRMHRCLPAGSRPSAVARAFYIALIHRADQRSFVGAGGARGGYNSDDITRVGVGGGVEPGGSDDGMTITICSFFALQLCLFAELDESAAALPP